MGYNKQKVIDLAISQLGYHEKASNSQLDSPNANAGSANWNKFARDLDKLPNFYNGPKNIGPDGAWCDIFVDWCFVTAYGREAAQFLLCQPNGSAGAGCQFSAQYFNQHGQFHASGPRTGDQIFFGSSWANVWHTGLVVDVGNGTVTTVEGNSADQVARRVYSQNDWNIFGYGRPDWGEADEPVVDGEGESIGDQIKVPVDFGNIPVTVGVAIGDGKYLVEVPLLTIGDKGGYVKAAQTLLIARGYDCGNKPLIGTEKADGKFGSTTERAVAFFQSAQGLDVDGEIGCDTWTALLKNF